MMKDMTVSQFQWAMSRLEGNKAMFSPELAQAINISRYLGDMVIARGEIDGKSSVAEIILKVESLILQGKATEAQIFSG
jgi:hypothetical protein